MLTKFAVTNFRGFAERIEWDLSNPSNYEFSPYAVKNNTIKNGIIYGPNGSGKTNFGLAIFDIEYHLSQKWKKPDFLENYIYAGRVDGLVEFEYTFKFDSYLIHYCYSKNAQGLLVREILRVNGLLVFEKLEDSFYIDDNSFPMEDTIKSNFKGNVNNVSVINFLLSSYPVDASHYLIKLRDFVDSMLWFRNLDVREFIGLETSVTRLEEYIISQNLVSDFANFLKEVSDQEFELTPDESGKQLLCRIGNTLIHFQLIASTGTRSLQLLYFWIQRMVKEASFVFIDEFDAFYHYKLSYEVCQRLFNLDCQVFMSSHNTYLMTNELLRPDCNFILANGRIKPLSACTDKELRFGHNIEKIYRAGAFYEE